VKERVCSEAVGHETVTVTRISSDGVALQVNVVFCWM
jgi:hypothetical protein